MTRDEVVDAFRVSAKEVLGIDPSEFTSTTSLVTDLDADSLDIIEVILLVEEKLGVSIPDEMWEEVSNVGEAADAIIRLQASA